MACSNVVVSSIVLLSCVALAAASRASDLQKCLCFNAEADTSCEGSLTDQCKDYVITLVLTLWPSFIGGFIFVIVFPVVMLMRGCCNTCGGRAPSNGCCCVDEQGFKGYTTCERCWVRLAVYLSFFVVAAVGVVSFVRSATLKNGVSEVSDLLEGVQDQVTAAADTSVREFDALGEEISANERQVVANAAIIAKNTVNTMDSWRSLIVGFDHSRIYSRHNLTLLFIGLAMLLLFAAGFAAFCNIRKCLPRALQSGMLSIGATVCFMVAGYQLFSFSTTDVCDSYAETTGQLDNRIQSALQCLNSSPQNGLGQVISLVETKAKPSFASRVCNDLRVCTLFTCPESCNPVEYDTIALIPDNSSVADPRSDLGSCELPCSVRMCATQCVNGSILQVTAQEAMDIIEENSRIFTSLEQVVYPVANCSIIPAFFSDLEDPLCDDVNHGSTDMWGLSLCVLVFLFIGAVLMMLGAKRFTPAQDQYKELQSEGAGEKNNNQPLYPSAPPPPTTYGTAQRQ